MRSFLVRFIAIAGVAGIAFLAGLSTGRAQAPSIAWGPAVIHISQMTPKPIFLHRAPGAYARVKVLARNEDNAVVQVQMGATKKHYHSNSNEAQYILKGSGMFWLGDKQVPVGPGDLIIIPKGTAHGMESPIIKRSRSSPRRKPRTTSTLCRN